MKKQLLSLACILASTFGIAQIPNYVPSDGLKAWYPFTNNANDMSINAKNGIVKNATLTNDRFGNANSAYSFNGVDAYIDIDTLQYQAFSQSSWIKLDAVNPSNLSAIISSLYNSVYKGLELRIEPNSSIMVVVGQGSSWKQPTTNSNLSLNQWYHVVVTSDKTTLKIYLNNQQIASYGISNFTNTTSKTLIGVRDHTVSNGGWFDGDIDDIGIWNRALNTQEISDLYNANICYQSVSVTDTLVMNMNITGFNPITYSNSVKIYPNPTSTGFVVDYGDFSQLSGYTLKVLNASSQEVFTNSVNQQTTSINASGWAKGVYTVQLIDAATNTISTKKLIIQ